MTTTQRRIPRWAVEGCPGRHAPPPWEAEDLGWFPPYGQVRVLEYTCGRCAAISYEFCLLGGGYMIRRTDWSGRSAVTKQTAVVQRLVALRWWEALMAGRAS